MINIFQHEKRNFVSPSGHVSSIYYINTNEMPNHFTLTFFLLRRRDVSCSHSNRDLFTCEDIMFSPGISLVFI